MAPGGRPAPLWRYCWLRRFLHPKSVDPGVGWFRYQSGARLPPSTVWGGILAVGEVYFRGHKIRGVEGKVKLNFDLNAVVC